MSSSLRTSASAPRVSHVYTQSAMRPLLIVASLPVCRPGREIKPDKVEYVYQSPYGGGGGGTPQSFTGHLMFAVFVLFFVNPIFGLMALALAGALHCCVYTEPSIRTHGLAMAGALQCCVYTEPSIRTHGLAMAGELQCCVYTEPSIRTHGLAMAGALSVRTPIAVRYVTRPRRYAVDIPHWGRGHRPPNRG